MDEFVNVKPTEYTRSHIFLFICWMWGFILGFPILLGFFGIESRSGAMMSGRNKTATAIKSIKSKSRGFKYKLGIATDSNAPTTPPRQVGISIGKIASRWSAPCLSYPLKPTMHCSITATLFVPLAMSAGSPRSIKTGRDRFEPPPAIVLMLPANKPVAINTIISKKVSSTDIPK